MSKAILVIDMPESCSECPCFNDSFDYPTCIITNESKGYRFNGYTTKMNNCPLVVAPNKAEHYLGENEYHDGQVTGWNDCLEEILGEKE